VGKNVKSTASSDEMQGSLAKRAFVGKSAGMWEQEVFFDGRISGGRGCKSGDLYRRMYGDREEWIQ
jgi:hypothetical protein